MIKEIPAREVKPGDLTLDLTDGPALVLECWNIDGVCIFNLKSSQVQTCEDNYIKIAENHDIKKAS